jgi:glycosyltransferase involved in cell wall biosynthesis
VLIVGDGPDREKLQALAGQVSPSNVWFFGQRYDVPVLLAAADVVAIPSLAEGHPMILIEAMAAEKPIAASDVGGIADAVEDGRTGLLVPPADHKALAEAIIRVLDSSNLASWLGSESRRWAEKKFAVGQMIHHTEEVYLCVVS